MAASHKAEIDRLNGEISKLRKLGRTKREPLNTFGGAVQLLREAKGIGVTELGVLTGLGKGMICRIETHARPNPEWETIKAIASGLNIQIAELIGNALLAESFASRPRKIRK